jgi:D-xylose transport system ATP-binding protein
MNMQDPALPQGQPRLALRGMSKRFGAITALDRVDFEVYPAEVVALVGDNGAGKSTLAKIIAGVYRADSGTITFEGREVAFSSPEEAGVLGIATVYQDLALCDNLDVVANLFLGRELGPRRLPIALRWTQEDDMERRAREVLSSLSVRLPSLRRPVKQLSGGQRQSVAVSRAVLWGSKVVLLDEPTAALGVEQTAMVQRLIVHLRAMGLSVVLISHNLTDVFQVADRIVVLRLGRRVGTFTASQTTPDQVIAAITSGGTESVEGIL